MGATFCIDSTGGEITTRHLSSLVCLEIGFDGCDKLDNLLRDSAIGLLRLLAQYFVDTGRTLDVGQTVDWASSLLIARKRNSTNTFYFDEMAYDGRTILRGVHRCLATWDAQSRMCRRFDSPFEPANFGSLVAVSPGVLLSAAALQGVRYAKDGRMTGWWIFEQGYDGSVDNFASMQTAHVFHLIACQPRVAPILGLGVGYAFRVDAEFSGDTQAEIAIWYEEDIGGQSV